MHHAHISFLQESFQIFKKVLKNLLNLLCYHQQVKKYVQTACINSMIILRLSTFMSEAVIYPASKII